MSEYQFGCRKNLITYDVMVIHQELYGIVLYSSIYIAPLNSLGPTEALSVRLAPRKKTSLKKR